MLQAPLVAADFALMVAEAAYNLGAGHVTMLWVDDRFTRLEYDRCSLEQLSETPAWKIAQYNDLSAAGATVVTLVGSDPDALKGVDPQKPAAVSRARNTQCDVWRHNLDFGISTWVIAGVPTPAWAQKVFLGVPAEEAVNRLWAAILAACRVEGGSDATPAQVEAAWEAHNATLKRNCARLNELGLAKLHYTASNGTNLEVGLLPHGIWEAGAGTTVAGLAFMPNIPTEEVFTTPDRSQTHGRVVSALPLVVGGVVVRDFWFEFECGRVVAFGAAEGQEALEQLLAIDESARYLGECALISKNTPLRQMGTLFYNTLFDENASCHLALGMGFPECVEGGLEKTKDELFELGVNQSATHNDFMIGTQDLAITGITRDGREVPIFVNGAWAWE
jgi:aminopeptidase